MASLERNFLLNHNEPLNQKGGEEDMVEREGWRRDKEIDKEGAVMCCCEKDGKKYRIMDGSINEKRESIIFLNESVHKKNLKRKALHQMCYCSNGKLIILISSRTINQKMKQQKYSLGM